MNPDGGGLEVGLQIGNQPVGDHVSPGHPQLEDQIVYLGEPAQAGGFEVVGNREDLGDRVNNRQLEVRNGGSERNHQHQQDNGNAHYNSDGIRLHPLKR